MSKREYIVTTAKETRVFGDYADATSCFQQLRMEATLAINAHIALRKVYNPQYNAWTIIQGRN